MFIVKFNIMVKPYLIIQNERDETIINEPAYNFAYKLDTFQHNAHVAIETQNESALVVAHTMLEKVQLQNMQLLKHFN